MRRLRRPHRRSRERGVAMIIAVVAIAILTTVAVDFAYNSRVDLQLAEGRNLDVITQAETRTSFANALGLDYERYTSGTVMLETAERLVAEEKEPSVQQFLLLVAALRAMAGGERRPGLVLDSYLLRSLAVAGYAPSFDDCAHCGRTGPHKWVNPSMGGVLCSTCWSNCIAAPAAARRSRSSPAIARPRPTPCWPRPAAGSPSAACTWMRRRSTCVSAMWTWAICARPRWA